LFDGVVAALGESGALQGVTHSSSIVRTGQLEGVGEELQELADAHVLVHSGLIGQVANQAFYFASLASNAEAANLCCTAVNRQKSGKDLHQGGFAGAVRTD
jgi:hypothetical protein